MSLVAAAAARQSATLCGIILYRHANNVLVLQHFERGIYVAAMASLSTSTSLLQGVNKIL